MVPVLKATRKNYNLKRAWLNNSPNKGNLVISTNAEPQMNLARSQDFRILDKKKKIQLTIQPVSRYIQILNLFDLLLFVDQSITK